MSSTKTILGDSPPRGAIDRIVDEGRLRLLAVLRDRDSPAGVDQLAIATAGRDGHESAQETADEAIRCLRIDLAHSHLPILEEMGLVALNEATETVEPTDRLTSWGGDDVGDRIESGGPSSTARTTAWPSSCATAARYLGLMASGSADVLRFDMRRVAPPA